jgi:hypothetical protein
MQGYPIARQNEHDQPPNKDQFKIHFYPFDTLPPFRSHVHPKFAIFELGRKYHELLKKNTAAANEAVESYPNLRRVHRIYAAWTKPVKGMPEFDDWKGQGGAESDEDRQSESSSKTGYDSWRQGTKPGRAGSATERGSPTPSRKNSDAMQMANTCLRDLSYETLVEHEQVHGKGRWTPESLSGWVADSF